MRHRLTGKEQSNNFSWCIKDQASNQRNRNKRDLVCNMYAIGRACQLSFHIGDTVYTTQNHPEMTPEFMATLVTECALKLPADVAATAKLSIVVDADTLVYACSIAQFFENVVAP